MGGGVGGGVYKSQIFKQNLIISIRSRLIKFLVIRPDPTHWPTHPTTHLHTHPWVGVSLQIINLQTELNYLDSVKIFKIFSVLIWTHPSTHPPTYLPNHTPMHGWEILHRFQIFKRNWNILISSSVIECGSGRWVDGGGGRYGYVGVSHAHMHKHTCTCMLNMLNILNMDASMLAAFCNLYTCIHVCVCMCMHVDTPPMPPDTPHPPAPSPEPQGAQNTKFQ